MSLLSERAAAVTPSETLRIAAEVSRLRGLGVKVVSLLEGEADLPAPLEIKAATIDAIRRDQTRYSSSSGLPELKALIVKKLRAENGVTASPAQIVVTNGAKQAIFSALQAICGPGDEAIIPAPYWVTFPEAVRLAGAKPVFVSTQAHQLDVDALARAVTKRTKAVIINSPNNPTGAVYPAEALRELARLAKRRDLFIISDEAYEHLLFDDARHVSIAALGADAARRTITIQTFSKSYSMTGFRVGYLAAAPDVAAAVARIHGHMTGNVATFIQHGAAAALALGRAYHARRRAELEKHRDLAYTRATELFDCAKPRGGFFVFPDFQRRFGRRFKSSSILAAYLLKKARVALIPGSACGLEGHLRISFSSSEENIRAGFSRIAEALCP